MSTWEPSSHLISINLYVIKKKFPSIASRAPLEYWLSLMIFHIAETPRLRRDKLRTPRVVPPMAGRLCVEKLQFK